MIFFLDDDEYRVKTFRSMFPATLVAWTSWEIIKMLKEYTVPLEYLFLDHDLGGEQFVNPERENTGSEVVRWVVANKPLVERIIIHSHNEPAAKMMEADLLEAGYWVRRLPWIHLRSRLLSGQFLYGLTR